jgi:antitoxin PrlF
MNVQRGKLLSGGRLQIPSDVRRSLSLSDGDTILIEVVGGEIHLRPQRDAVSRIQARLREYIYTDESVTDELIADRRAEAAGE